MRQAVAEEMPQWPVFIDESAIFNEQLDGHPFLTEAPMSGVRVAEGFVNSLPKGEINRRQFCGGIAHYPDLCTTTCGLG